MKPKLPLPPELSNERAMPVVVEWAPEIALARYQLRKAAFRMGTLDHATTELVRMRNARFQECFY
jgi:hypothetical protein